MKKPSAAQLQLARRLFGWEVDRAASHEAIFAAAMRGYEQTFSRLTLFFGVSAARALFARSLKLAATGFPPFANAQLSSGNGRALAEQIVKALEGAPPDVAAEAALTTFVTLLELLERLIGESPTDKVLRNS